MFDEYSRRELAATAGAILVLCAVSAWGSINVIKNYVLGVRDSDCSGWRLKAEQIIQPK
jgi:hypothetical protein